MGDNTRCITPGFRKQTLVFGWFLAGLAAVSACRLALGVDPAQATEVAVRVQQTQLAGTSTEAALSSTQETIYIIPTPGQGEAEGQQTATLTAMTPVTGGALTEVEIPNFERRRKAARILLFENMSASGYIRYVQEALEQGGYFYLDVGSATGWFRDQLQSQEEWDLVIAAAEARRDFGGESFELINQRLETGAAAIVEHWDIDLAPGGKVGDLLASCGLQFDADWYEPQLRVFFWLVPEHPVFHTPYQIPPFTNASWLWNGDIGDLLDIRYQAGQPVGDAILLAGTNPGIPDQHGTLAICLGNRLILQTFGSHEYPSQDMIHLWQNYIYQALQGRFASQETSLVPTPWSPAASPPTAGVAGSCQSILAATLPRPYRTQRQLFEHNAVGEYIIVDLQLKNLSQAPIQIWDDDYRLEGILDGASVSYPIQKAATGYLFIDQPDNLWQDLLVPNQDWETTLAFDVDPRGHDWILNLSPGAEVNEQICRLEIPLS